MLDLKALLSKILDALKVDYVVEEGTSGRWTYRKWNSGIGECWCDDTWTTTWSFYTTGLYISGTLTKVTPFTFYNADSTAHVSVNVKSAGSNWGWSAITRFSTNNLVAFGVVRNGNTGNVSASIYCVGRWK